MPIKAVVFDAYGTLYDIQSVAVVTEATYPGYGDVITQIWRMKQLEYTWLRSLMGQYRDFATVTQDSLTYTLKLLGLAYDGGVFAGIMSKYLDLDLYPDSKPALVAMSDRKLAILSNGSPKMLDELVQNSGLDGLLSDVISVDRAHSFKPSPKAYELVETALGFAPEEVLFVSSNAFDASGAKSFGFRVAWIERVTGTAMAEAFADGKVPSPLTMFKALRMQMDELGFEPDYRVRSLAALSDLFAKGLI